MIPITVHDSERGVKARPEDQNPIKFFADDGLQE